MLTIKNMQNEQNARRILEQRKKDIIRRYSSGGDYLISDDLNIVLTSDYGYNKEEITVEYLEYYKEAVTSEDKYLRDVSVEVSEDDNGNLRGSATPQYETRSSTSYVTNTRTKYLTETFYIKTVKSGMGSKVSYCENEISRNEKLFSQCKFKSKEQKANIINCTIYTFVQFLLPILTILYAVIYPYQYTFTKKTFEAESWFPSKYLYDNFLSKCTLELDNLFFIVLGLIVVFAILEIIFNKSAIDQSVILSFDRWVFKVSIFTYCLILLEILIYSIYSEHWIIMILLLITLIGRLLMYLFVCLKFIYTFFLVISGGHYFKLRRHIKKREKFRESGKFDELLEYEKIIINSLV